MKIRLDKLLVDLGHAASRERAQALILAGRVLVDEQRIDKPGTPIAEAAAIRMLGDDLRYVSRGGLKLERALSYWKLSLEALACLDVGASTGGFTDCMLQNGAQSVLAIDTGYGQIHQRLRDDPRVSLMERTNARLLAPHSLVRATQDRGDAVDDIVGGIPSASPIRFIAMDVSFISATLVLPAVLAALATPSAPWHGDLVLLIKPQFEAGREHIGKGGIVRDPAARQLAIDRVVSAAHALKAMELDLIDSPIRGMEGNHEYLLHATF
jgi:23S rRNA (cytidine1920-2'-O)/16S rRNA (cytidine1409-2'-O)-methyltransferase